MIRSKRWNDRLSLTRLPPWMGTGEEAVPLKVQMQMTSIEIPRNAKIQKYKNTKIQIMTNCNEAVGGELAEGRQMRHIREKAPDFMAAQCLSRFMRLFLSTIYVVQSQPLWII